MDRRREHSRTVDTDQDAGLLSKFGINPADLLGGAGGGIGDKLGF